MSKSAAKRLVKDKAQEAVITASADSRLLVEAGPGAGKTEVVARRLAWLLSKGNLRPRQILVLSFSRSAVRALIQRIRALRTADQVAVEGLRYLSVRTFDSWSFRMLRFLGHKPADLLNNSSYDENIATLLSELRQLGPGGALDAEELRLHLVRHVIVDEYQDLVGVRAALVQALLEVVAPPEDDHCGFTVLGDPNQAIYDYTMRKAGSGETLTSRGLAGWLQEEYEDGLEVVPFETNHRSTPEVSRLVRRAEDLLHRCEDADESPLPGLLDLIHEAGGASAVEDLLVQLQQPGGGGRIAVLCRGNSQILELAARVNWLTRDIGADTSRLRFVVGTPPRLLPSWIAKLLHQNEAGQLTRRRFERIFSHVFAEDDGAAPCQGSAEAAWNLLLSFARLGEDETAVDMDQLRRRITWPDSLPDDEGETDDRIVVTTIHQAKGLEYDSVKIIHDGQPLDEESDCHEEGRVLFVGVSRAHEDLALLQLDEGKQFYPKKLDDGRRRWHRWFKSGINQLELGCEGDVDRESIIRMDVMGGAETVAQVQTFLSDNEAELIGRPVVLRKTKLPVSKPRYVYRICLLEDDEQEICLGQMHEWVTRDLLKVKHRNQSLPTNIWNLRITGITSAVGGSQMHETIPEPWCSSRIWLSVNVHGLAQFKLFWRNS